jgi:hypothetical protein
MVVPNRSCSIYRESQQISHENHLKDHSSLTSSLGNMYSAQIILVYQPFCPILGCLSTTTHCPVDIDDMCGHHLLLRNQTRLLLQR